jgi:hypothetical protein
MHKIGFIYDLVFCRDLDELVSQIGMISFLQRRSSGMRQIVATAKWHLQRSRIYRFEDPTVFGKPKSRCKNFHGTTDGLLVCLVRAQMKCYFSNFESFFQETN